MLPGSVIDLWANRRARVRVLLKNGEAVEGRLIGADVSPAGRWFGNLAVFNERGLFLIRADSIVLIQLLEAL